MRLKRSKKMQAEKGKRQWSILSVIHKGEFYELTDEGERFNHLCKEEDILTCLVQDDADFAANMRHKESTCFWFLIPGKVEAPWDNSVLPIAQLIYSRDNKAYRSTLNKDNRARAHISMAVFQQVAEQGKGKLAEVLTEVGGYEDLAQHLTESHYTNKEGEIKTTATLHIQDSDFLDVKVSWSKNAQKVELYIDGPPELNLLHYGYTNLSPRSTGSTSWMKEITS